MRYDNDPRVVSIDGDTYWLPNGKTRWTIRREGGEWNAYNQDGDFCKDASRMGSADEAIAAVVGDPQ